MTTVAPPLVVPMAHVAISTDVGYECECESGYIGQNFTTIDHCLINPCSLAHSTFYLNHPEGTGAISICSPSWGGDHCDKDIDEGLKLSLQW